MGNSSYDLLIFSAKKDYNKIKFLHKSLHFLNPAFNRIYCICPTIPSEKIDGIIYVRDQEVFDFDISKINHPHPNWIKQQLMKLSQNITSDNYLTIDSDVILTGTLPVYLNNKPSFFFGRNQFHEPYFKFSENVFNLPKVVSPSFICEVMLFKREFLRPLLFEMNTDELFNLCVDNITPTSYLSEFELYGNYVFKNHVDSYNYLQINTLLNGKNNELWTDQAIQEFMDQIRSSEYSIVSFHSWFDNRHPGLIESIESQIT